MTDDEKNVLKQLGKMVSELAYVVGVYEAILKKNVRDWREQIEVANASPDFQALRQEIDRRQREIESLINKNNLDSFVQHRLSLSLPTAQSSWMASIISRNTDRLQPGIVIGIIPEC
jgi:hypothetical protein